MSRELGIVSILIVGSQIEMSSERTELLLDLRERDLSLVDLLSLDVIVEIGEQISDDIIPAASHLEVSAATQVRVVGLERLPEDLFHVISQQFEAARDLIQFLGLVRTERSTRQRRDPTELGLS